MIWYGVERDRVGHHTKLTSIRRKIIPTWASRDMQDGIVAASSEVCVGPERGNDGTHYCVGEDG